MPAGRSGIRPGVKEHLLTLATARLSAAGSDVEAGAALGAAVLLELEAIGDSRRARNPTELRLAILRPGAQPPRQTATLAANEDGLFDVTDFIAG